MAIDEEQGEPQGIATTEAGPDTPAGQTAAQRVNLEASGNNKTDAERARARQSLELQRERILSERTSSPHRRSALSDALASVEEQLSELGWMLHL